MSAARDVGYTALQSGDVSGAIVHLEQAVAADPNDFQTCLYLGAAYGQAERHWDAVTVLTSAVHLQPANPQARYNLAVALESADYPEQALTAARQAVQLQPDYVKAQEMVARLSGDPAPPSAYSPPAGSPAGSPYAQTQQQLPYYGQPMSSGQSGPSQPPYSPPQQPYGQPPQPYGQPAPSQMPYGGSPLSAPYQGQGAAAYGGAPTGIQGQPYIAGPMFQTDAQDANTALILSVLSLVFGCFVCGGFLAPFAIGYAIKAKKQIAMNPNLSGDSKATVALVLGIIGSLWLAVWLFYFVAVLVAAGGR